MEVVLVGGIILTSILLNTDSKEKFKQVGGSKIKETLYKAAPSPIGGVGLFALGDIPKGTKILQDRIRPTGRFYTKEELKDLNPKFVRTMQDYWCLGNDGKTFIPDNPHIISPVNFINHSDEPNVEYKGDYFLVVRDIKDGEEILENYHHVCNGKHIMFE